MRAGQRVILDGSDAAAVAEEWRDVAKQYESAFETNGSCVYCYTNHFKDLLTIPLQILLNSVTCRPNVAFDHFFDRLLVWFVYIHDFLFFLFQQPSVLLREHIPLNFKAL